MLIIRPESRSQAHAVGKIHELAFGRPAEARLVEALRQSDGFLPQLSLVATQDKELVGHILLSPIAIQGEGPATPALALAPLAVLPEYQSQGVGSQLVRCALERCEGLGHPLVVVLGHPRYYTRFGFERASLYGIRCPYPLEDDSAFMVWCANPALLATAAGTVVYPAAFEGV